MSYAISGVLAAVLGVLVIVLVGGPVGLVAGAVSAALMYLGMGRLLRPEARLGGVVASMLPDGEAALAKVTEARGLLDRLRAMAPRVRQPQVRSEVSQLVTDIENLVAYVERQPNTYRRLSHFMATYGPQCDRVVSGYLSLEGGGSEAVASGARADAISALNALEGAAQGELQRAMGAKVAELSADSDAVRRLMEMDGYRSDAREAGPAGEQSAQPAAPALVPGDSGQVAAPERTAAPASAPTDFTFPKRS